MEMETNNLRSLRLTENSLTFMAEVVKWAKFIAICSFVGLGIMVLMAVGVILLQFQGQVNGIQAIVMGIFYILMAALYFFPAFYLYRFATASAVAIENLDEDNMEEGLENLKSLFRFTGILMIVVLSLYAVVLMSMFVMYMIKM